MLRISFLLLCLMLMAACSGGGSGGGETPAPKMDKFITPVETPTPGSLFVSKKLIGKDLIFGGYITNFETEADYLNLAGLIGQFMTTRLVRLEVNPKDPKALDVYKSTSRPWVGATEGNTMKTLLARIAIAEDKGDKYLITGVELAKSLLTVMALEGYDPQKTTTTQVLPGLKVSGDSLVVPVEQRWGVPMGGGVMYRVGVQITYFMKLREDNPKFEIRTASSKFGYFTLEDMYYQSHPSYKRQVHLRPETRILRWDLNKKVTYVMSKNVPERFRPLIKAGVESWNPVLSQATGEDKMYVEVVEESDKNPAVMGDPNSNVIYWERDESKGASMMYASWSNDPITGEIFNSHVYIGGYELIKRLEEIYDYHTGVKPNRSTQRNVQEVPALTLNGKRIGMKDRLEIIKKLSGKKDISFSFGEQKFHAFCDRGSHDAPVDILGEAPKVTKDEYVNSWIQDTLIHEVGHNLGLRHNFKGSLSYVTGKTPTASTMDYNPDSIYYRGEPTQKPGIYDIQAINYGYGGKSPTKGTESAFCTDEETLPFFGITDYDAKCARYDDGPDPLSEALKRLKLSYIMLNIETDQYEREMRMNGFFRNLANLSLAYGSSQKVSAADKTKLADAIASLIEMQSYTQKTTGQTVAFSSNPYFEGTKTLMAAYYVFFAVDWTQDEGPSVSSSMGNSIKKLLSRDGTKSSFAEIQLVMELVTILGGNTANQNNQAVLWKALDDASAHAASVAASPRASEFQKESFTRLKNLLEDRKKVFVGISRERQ